MGSLKQVVNLLEHIHTAVCNMGIDFNTVAQMQADLNDINDNIARILNGNPDEEKPECISVDELAEKTNVPVSLIVDFCKTSKKKDMIYVRMTEKEVLTNAAAMLASQSVKMSDELDRSREECTQLREALAEMRNKLRGIEK